MCGIAGIFDRAGRRDIPIAALRAMTNALAHRGPDGDGFHVEPGVGLGHRRLAIIDIAGGRQPMYNEDGSIAIVFNGEIYDYDALRQILEREGHVFRSRCDTETIIHAWESWGPDCLEHLSGMFAFAIWDGGRDQLFLARDRLGKKPIHYATLPDGRFVFASELPALTVLPELERRISETAVDRFFAFGFVPDPETIYRDVQKLPAGHFLLLDRHPSQCGLAPQARRYWKPRFDPRPVGPVEAKRELLAHLDRSVASRLIADVPLGAFLSGGLNSSAVVAAAARLRSSPLSTFTIGFPGGADERAFADIIASRYRTAHRSEADCIDYIEAARGQAAIFGEPFGDSSSVPTHRVCALARQNVTVALSGDGGDEIFVGYRRYRWHRLAEAVRSLLPGAAGRRAVGFLARIYPKLDRAPRWLRAKYTLTEIGLDSALGYYRMLCKLQDEQRRALLLRPTDGCHPSDMVVDLMAEADTDDPLLQAQYVDVNLYLVGDILTKVDRASMANSLEVRAPLLDHRLIEWAGTLPASLKLRRGDGKHLFKAAMAGRLPSEIIDRRKQGFALDLAVQLRSGIDRVRQRLLGGAMQGSALFAAPAVGRMIDEHASGQFDHSASLWQLLVFEGFLNTHFRHEPAARFPPNEMLVAADDET